MNFFKNMFLGASALVVASGSAFADAIDAPTNTTLTMSAVHTTLSDLAGTAVNLVVYGLGVIVAIAMFFIGLRIVRGSVRS